MDVRDHKNVGDVTPVLRKFNDLVLVEMMDMHKKFKNRGAVLWKDM